MEEARHSGGEREKERERELRQREGEREGEEREKCVKSGSLIQA